MPLSDPRRPIARLADSGGTQYDLLHIARDATQLCPTTIRRRQAMEENKSLRDQFTSIRHEIEGLQLRLFWTVMVGILGVPTMTYLTWDTDALVWIVMPFFMLVIIILFLAQHQQMMRAGRFIREEIEPRLPDTPSWEGWLESKPEFRLLDRSFFACFTLIFFAYYFVSMATSIERLWGLAQEEESGLYWPFLYGALASYAIATLWAIFTLVHHWRSSVGTGGPAASGRAD
jgi:hypothetical protein